jgi:hypothetical protein
MKDERIEERLPARLGRQQLLGPRREAVPRCSWFPFAEPQAKKLASHERPEALDPLQL